MILSLPLAAMSESGCGQATRQSSGKFRPVLHEDSCSGSWDLKFWAQMSRCCRCSVRVTSSSFTSGFTLINFRDITDSNEMPTCVGVLHDAGCQCRLYINVFELPMWLIDAPSSVAGPLMLPATARRPSLSAATASAVHTSSQASCVAHASMPPTMNLAM